MRIKTTNIIIRFQGLRMEEAVEHGKHAILVHADMYKESKMIPFTFANGCGQTRKLKNGYSALVRRTP